MRQNWLVASLIWMVCAACSGVQADELNIEDLQRLMVEAPTAQQSPQFEIPVEFSKGSDQILPRSRANLNRIAQALLSPQLAMIVVAVEGHTDMSGSYRVNRDLSQRRAEAVRQYLYSQGVALHRMQAFGYANDQLLPGLSMNAPQHRRVVLRRIQ